MFALDSLPTTVFSHSLSFLSSEDFLELRLVNRWLLKLIESDEADILWRQALIHDFKFSPSINIHDQDNDLHFLRSLRVRENDDHTKQLIGTTPSIFGYPASESIFVANKPFESWKYWAKASSTFWKRDDANDDANDKQPSSTMFINGPCKYNFERTCIGIY